MHPYEVFSARALRHGIGSGVVRDVLSEAVRSPEPLDQALLTSVVAGNVRYWSVQDDTPRARKIVVRRTPTLEQLTGAMLAALLERVLNLAERTRARPLRVPTAWHAWNDQDHDRVSFYAVSRGRITGNPRVVAQVFLQDGDVFVWDLRGDDDSTRYGLAALEVDTSEYYRAVNGWEATLATADERRTTGGEAATSPFVVDLPPPATSGAAHERSYSEWLESSLLTDEQQGFIRDTTSNAIRLKGPAGSGKTLALELRAIDEARQLKEAGRAGKILFATHSWSITEQVQEDIRRMDDIGVASMIEVLPLLEVVSELRPLPDALELLGSDNEEGQAYQTMCTSMVVEDFVATDWVTFKAACRDAFVRQLEAAAEGDGIESIVVGDLVREFSIAIGGEGIQDGPRDQERYLDLDRGPWAMDLSDPERRAVYAMYRKYLHMTRDAGQLTSDQFITTGLGWLKGFEWGALRRHRGYDAIYVDELHLFNPQERGVLNHLGCDPSRYPRLFMSLDPLQSTTGRFGALGIDRAIEGEQESVELHEIHRFTPEILALARHINLSIPTEDFGEQWGIDLTNASSTVPPGPKPRLIDSASVGEEEVAIVNEVNDALTRSGRVAIAVVDPRRAQEVFDAVERLLSPRMRIAVVRTRDDLGFLNYSTRGVVVGKAEDLAGLQFSEVIIGGMSDPTEIETVEHRRLSFLSSLYLATSRASERVTIVVDSARNGEPTILSAAVGAGVLVRS